VITRAKSLATEWGEPLSRLILDAARLLLEAEEAARDGIM
jgi:hypothetical protein